MYENEKQRQPHGCADGVGVCNAPRYAGQKHEEGEKVGEGGVGSMPCVFRFCYSLSERGGWVASQRCERTFLGDGVSGEDSGGGCRKSYVIVDRSEDLLWRYKEACHLPDCHLEIHLGEFE